MAILKILLINNDSMVKKLFEAVAKKLGLDLTTQDNLNLPNTEDDFFLFIDDSISGDYSEILSSGKNLMKTYLHKRNSKQVEGFEFYIKKPFLPTEVLDILKTRLSDFGITEATTSNLTKDDLEEIPEYSFALDDFNLDEADDLGLKDIEDEYKGSSKSIPHISDNFNLDDLQEIQSALEDMEKEKTTDNKEKLEIPVDIIDEDDEDLEVLPSVIEEEQEEEPDIEGILENIKSDVEKSKKELEEESKINPSIELEQETHKEDEKIHDKSSEAIEDSDMRASFLTEDLLDDLQIDQKEQTEQEIEEQTEQQEQSTEEENSISKQNIIDDFTQDGDFGLDEKHNDEYDDFNLDKAIEDNEAEEISDFSNILDKKQIDEVKKILAQTEDEENQNKEVPMALASEAKEIEEIEEQDIMDILGDSNKGKKMKKTKTKNTKNTTPEDLDVSFDKIDDFEMMKDEFDKSALTEDLDVEEPSKNKSGSDIENFINNTSIDGLKSILDGMQLTINISFPNKKK